MSSVKADIDDRKNNILVQFDYDFRKLYQIRKVPGARWDARKKKWVLPANMLSARALKNSFKDEIKASPELKAWGRARRIEERRAQRPRRAELKIIPKKMPQLHQWLRPYQQEDIAFMADRNCINACQPGLGKTIETIGAVIESGNENDSHLVIAPATSIDLVWTSELRRWLPESSVVTWHGGLTSKQKTLAREAFGKPKASSKGRWLITTPNMLRAGTLPCPMDKKFQTVIVDEFHSSGLCNSKSLFFKQLKKIRAQQKIAISGTPMGGKEVNLWPVLNWLEPKEYRSKWQWVDYWLEVDDGFYGKLIGGVKPDKEKRFNLSLKQHMVRRLKSDVAKELPEKQHVEVICPMTPKQQTQYDEFAAQAEIIIENERLSAIGILAELTRLQQMANARCLLQGEDLLPTTDSGKLQPLYELLTERGLTKENAYCGESTVIASKSSKMIDMVAEWLAEKKVKTHKITGATKASDRLDIVRDFQDSGPESPRVLCLTTTAGGVAITLDRADSIHILDQTWNPDDQEQVEDRIHRISRAHNVTVYNYIAKDTIEERVRDVNCMKTSNNIRALDRDQLARMLSKEPIS